MLSLLQRHLPFPTPCLSIIFVEFQERYAYYAFRAILSTYFLTLGMSEHSATSLFLFTSALAYFTPVFGGLLSDGLLGKYTTIMCFSTVYVIGLATLAGAAYQESVSGTFTGLILIGIGTGGIKPCVSSFGADQLPPAPQGGKGGDSAALRSYFSAFYFSINVGALLSYVLSPLFKQHLGYGFAFTVPAIMMACAVLLLVKNKNQYRIVKPTTRIADSPVVVVLSVVYHATKHKLTSLLRPPPTPPKTFLHHALLSNPTLTLPHVTATLSFFRTLRFVLLMPVFWMLYDQQGSVWILQAQRMQLPKWVQPEQLGVCNTLMVLILLPVLEKFVYAKVEILRRPLVRMSCGMVLGGVAFILSALVENRIVESVREKGYIDYGGCASGEDMVAVGGACEAHSDCVTGACLVDVCGYAVSDVSFVAQIPQYLILTVAEIGVSTTGLEFFYAEAPVSLRTASSAVFLLTTAVGDLMGGILYEGACGWGLSSSDLLFVCGGLMLGVSCVFVKFSTTYVYRAEEEGKEEEEEEEEVELSNLIRGAEESSC